MTTGTKSKSEQLSKFVFTGREYFCRSLREVRECKEYLDLIRKQEKPCITLRQRIVCLDIVEGFSRSQLDFTDETIQAIRQTFRLRQMSRRTEAALASSRRVFEGTYATREDAIAVANALAVIDYSVVETD